MRKILNDAWMLCENPLSANTYIFMSDKKILVIDPGFKENGRRVLEFIRNTSINEAIIVVTHCHYDHIASLPLFKGEKVKICAHEAEAKFIEEADSITTVAFAFGSNWMGYPITRRLKNDDIINLENFKFKIIHTPGHTKGSICLYEPTLKILVSGDTVFANGIFGRCDLPTGNIKDMASTLAKLCKLDVEILLPGHGDIVLSNAKKHIFQAFQVIQRYVET